MTRLAQAPTQRIDRNKRLSFTWQGRPCQGLAGDSVATALFASGVRIFGRSLKYHRPRGLFSLDGESANTLVSLDGECNVRAETTLLKEGMAVIAQNSAGPVERDRLAFLDWLDLFMPAGFYYRRFHKPAAVWPLALPQIRKMAGGGRVDLTKVWKREDFAELYLNAEVCVVGGGPAGISAALAAAKQGLRVILLEARPWLGGFYDWRVRDYSPGRPLYEQGAKLASRIGEAENIRVLTQTFVIDLCGDNLLTAFQVGGRDDSFIQRLIQIRPTSVVVATGCLERPLIFENNERPGVMQAGCAVRLARTYALLPGEQGVFSVGDDLGLEAASDLAQVGLKVLAVADARPQGHDPALVAAIKAKGIPFLPGWAASKAEGAKMVSGVVLGDLNGTERKRFKCDLIVASAGLTPLAGPLATAGARFSFDEATNFFLPAQLPPRLHPAGRLLGYSDAAAIEASGTLAGLKAGRDAGAEGNITEAEEALAALDGPAKACSVVHGPGLGKGAKSFICFDEDGTYKEARQSLALGFDTPELAKRFAGFGLGPGQGGVPGHNLPLVLAEMRGDPLDGLAPTTIRSPLVPTLVATLAGFHHQIFKQTPMHQKQEAAGAIFRRVGVWKRARYFSEDQTSAQEIEAVRQGVGIIDVSTLGKFRLHGPDALAALQRVYISKMRGIPEGKLKYSAMLNDDGCLIDDGVVAKVGQNDYYFTASTARAGATIEWFRYQTRREGWDFHMVNLTDALAAINLAGPNSRQVLSALTEADLSNEAFPYMGYRELTLGGVVPARALRLGFVGELSFELHFPASYGQTIWEWLLEAGREFGIRPFGLEAQFVLRLEKGHVIIGQETEQRVNLLDLGLGFLWDRQDLASKKVGAPALVFTEDQTDRLKLVGFKMNDASQTPGEGSVVYKGDSIKGFVCTARFSQTLGESIGLALVRQPLARPGGLLNIYQNDANKPLRFQATVTPTPFYDPEGRRLKS